MKIRGRLSIFGLDVNNKSIENVPDATTTNQPTTKSQVDSDIEAATESVIPKYATDPGVLVDGMLWYNTTQQVYKYTNGVSIITLSNTSNVPENIVWVNSKSDFPEAVGGIITLVDNISYFVTKSVDLAGDKIVCGIDNVILGGSNENCHISSTGLVTGVFITCTKSLTINDITIKDISTDVFDINGDNGAGGSDAEYNLFGSNFVNCPNIGVVKNFTNFIFTNGSFTNSGGLIFGGFCDIISFLNSTFSSSNTTIIKTLVSTIINKKIILSHSVFSVTNTAVGINIDVSTTIGSEKYVLDKIDFSGNGIYINGIDHTYNKSLFDKCFGIDNTNVIGTMYVIGNATPTIFSNSVSFFKILGTTLAGSFISKYTHSSNRLTCETIIKRKLFVMCTISFTGGNNKTFDFGIFDSKLGAVVPSSVMEATTDGAGKAKPLTIMCVVDHTIGDYVEIHTKNKTDITNITADINVIVKDF